MITIQFIPGNKIFIHTNSARLIANNTSIRNLYRCKCVCCLKWWRQLILKLEIILMISHIRSLYLRISLQYRVVSSSDWNLDAQLLCEFFLFDVLYWVQLLKSINRHRLHGAWLDRFKWKGVYISYLLQFTMHIFWLEVANGKKLFVSNFKLKIVLNAFRHILKNSNKNWVRLFGGQNRSDSSDGHRIFMTQTPTFNNSDTQSNFFCSFAISISGARKGRQTNFAQKINKIHEPTNNLGCNSFLEFITQCAAVKICDWFSNWIQVPPHMCSPFHVCIET